MDVFLVLFKDNVMSVLFLWFLVQLVLAPVHRLLGLFHKLTPIRVQQFHCISINLCLFVVDSDTAQTHLRSIKDVLDVLEQLPDVVLVWIPVREGVGCVQETREGTDQRMEGRVLEDDLLEGNIIVIMMLLRSPVTHWNCCSVIRKGVREYYTESKDTVFVDPFIADEENAKPF